METAAPAQDLAGRVHLLEFTRSSAVGITGHTSCSPPSMSILVARGQLTRARGGRGELTRVGRTAEDGSGRVA
jgi:hypothetical protein